MTTQTLIQTQEQTQEQKQRRELNLVYTPERGLNGLIVDTNIKYRLLGVRMPLQISFLARDTEVYAGVTYWETGGSLRLSHSPIFRIERIGLIVENNNDLANLLFEKSKALFRDFPSIREYNRKENMRLGNEDGKDVIYKWQTWNGPGVYATNNRNGKFTLHLGNQCTIKEKVPTTIIQDFDTLISDCIGKMDFNKVNGQHPSVRDRRYWVRHPEWINGA